MPETKAPEQRTVDVDVDHLAAEGNTLRGHAAVFNVLSEDLGGFRERIAPGAFSEVLQDDVRLLVDHKPPPLARTKAGTLRLSQDGRGLAFEADLPSTTAARDLRESVSRGDLDGASFRFTVGEETWDGDVRTVVKVASLSDVTVATYPAYPEASIELRSRHTQHTEEVTVENTEAEERTDTSSEENEKQGEERTEIPESGNGGLRVEDRTAVTEEPSMEQRIEDALHSVRKGESRALTTAISISPGELSTTLFDRLRAASVVLSTGIATLSTESDSVVYPTLTADVVADAYAEAAPVSATDPTFSTVTATPRKLAALVQTSNEALDDSDPSLATVLNDHLLRVLGLKLDQQLLEGSGTAPQIRGLKNVSGIQTFATGANGLTPTLDNIADAIALLEGVNVPLSRMAIVAHPRNVATFRKLKASTAGSYLWDADPSSESPTTVFGVPIVSSAQLTTTETQGSSSLTNSIYVYDVQSVVYVQRQPIEIELDRSRLFNSDQSEMRAKLRGDLIAPTPTGVVRITGALP
jgi:HK97 family phage major capsid protein/HK97 family phage prohead protease